jgi:hypothetical protein
MNKILSYIAHSNFLQSLASNLVVNLLPLSIQHNFSKYILINKIISTLSMDDINGDYIEYGCFTGSCIKHAARCYDKFKNYSTKLYGLDSFEGFPENIHKEFKNENFITDYNFVKKIENKFKNVRIIKGFFNETVRELDNKIEKIAFGFIDCDLAVSASPCIIQLAKKIVPGGFIMIDDFFNIDKTGSTICKEFYHHFKLDKNIFIYKYFGTGGICFRYLP